MTTEKTSAKMARETAEETLNELWADLLVAINEAAEGGAFSLRWRLPKRLRNKAVPTNFAIRLNAMGYDARTVTPFLSEKAVGLYIRWPYELKPAETK